MAIIPRSVRGSPLPLAANFIQNQHFDIEPGSENMVKAAVADVVRPAVAADNPDALANQFICDAKKLASGGIVYFLEFFFEFFHALSLCLNSRII